MTALSPFDDDQSTTPARRPIDEATRCAWARSVSARRTRPTPVVSASCRAAWEPTAPAPTTRTAVNGIPALSVRAIHPASVGPRPCRANVQPQQARRPPMPPGSSAEESVEVSARDQSVGCNDGFCHSAFRDHQQIRETRGVGLGGIEPPTSPLSGVRSNRLSYSPAKRRTSVAASNLLPSGIG